MEIGNLRHRITILENRTKIDSIGNHKAQWEEAFWCWAYVTVKTSKETTEAGVTKETRSVKFIIRQNWYLQSVNATTHRILFKNQEYDIKEILPDYEKMDYLTILAEVRKGGDMHECE